MAKTVMHIGVFLLLFLGALARMPECDGQSFNPETYENSPLSCNVISDSSSLVQMGIDRSQRQRTSSQHGNSSADSAVDLHQKVSHDYDFPVDVVYTWVKAPKEGSAAWTDIKKSCGGVDPQRYRNHGTLRASLFALQKFIPWVRKVFIVTAGEVPCFIDEITIPVEMVFHKQIYPPEKQKTDLPSHNSIAIETHLHRIPDLSEHFIYFNNDMFVGKPLEKSFFFSADGHALYYPQSMRTFMRLPSLANSCRQLSVEVEHQASPYRKSAIVEEQQGEVQHFEELSRQRCRKEEGKEEPFPFYSYTCYQLQHGYAKIVQDDAHVAFLRDSNMKSHKSWYAEVLKSRPARFCINDDFDREEGTTLESQKKALADFLREYLSSIPEFQAIPKKCSLSGSIDEAGFSAAL